MTAHSTLQRHIIDFLVSLPVMNDDNSQKAFIYSMGLDQKLQDQIHFGEPPAQFAPLLITKVFKYGKLDDGRYAIEAVLETAKNFVGQDKQAYCDSLLQEFNSYTSSKSSEIRGELQQKKNRTYLRSTRDKLFITLGLILVIVVVIYLVLLLIMHFMYGDSSTFGISEVIVKNQNNTVIFPIEGVYALKVNHPITVEIQFQNPKEHAIDIKWTTQHGQISIFSLEQTATSAINRYILTSDQNDYIKVFLLDQITGKRVEQTIMVQALE